MYIVVNKHKKINVADLDAVLAYINIKVLYEKQTVAMRTLHSLCGLNVGNNRYRGKQKTSSCLNWQWKTR